MIPPSLDLMMEWSRSRQEALQRVARKRRPAQPAPPVVPRAVRVVTGDQEVTLTADGVTIEGAGAGGPAPAGGRLASQGR